MIAKKSGFLVFLREVFSNFTNMGAVLPSSTFLAKALVQQIPSPQQGGIVELGAGTGVVTKALLKQGVPPQNIVVVERTPSLCQHLKERFPELCIIQGDACELTHLLAPYQHAVQAIISSLPLRSFSKSMRRQIGEQIDDMLQPGGRCIQFTYSWFKHHPHFPANLRLTHSKYVWFNLPPARVDVFCQDKSANHHQH